MPRDAAGNYFLPLAPVISGTLVTSTWANTTMDDLAASMTDSLSRSGNGPMLAPLRHTQGAENTPSVTFNNDQLTGFYSAAVGDMRATVSGVDRMRWLAANQFPQIWDNDASAWTEIGAGGVSWVHSPVIPVVSVIAKGYLTAGDQSTLMPENPTEGHTIAFADLNDDWGATNFLTLNGNGNTFTQDGTSVYNLDLKGAVAQFSFLNGSWQIVTFGRLSDAYGFNLENYYDKTETNALLDVKVNPNFIINGGFDIWQRGVGPLVGYTADRWLVIADNLALQSTDVPFQQAPYSIDVHSDSGVAQPTLYTSVELSNPTTNSSPFTPFRTYTLSFWAKRTEAQPYGVQVSFVDEVGSGTNSIIFVSATTNPALPSTWEQFIFNVTIPIQPNPTNKALQVRIIANNHVGVEPMFIALAKLEEGVVFSTFTRAGNSLAGELAMCQRYYLNSNAFGGVNRLTSHLDNGLLPIKVGQAQFPTVMRVPPTMAIQTYFGFTTLAPTFDQIGATSAAFTGTALINEESGVDAYTADAEL